MQSFWRTLLKHQIGFEQEEANASETIENAACGMNGKNDEKEEAEKTDIHQLLPNSDSLSAVRIEIKNLKYFFASADSRRAFSYQMQYYGIRTNF